MSDKNITLPATSDYILTPKWNCFGTTTKVEFKGSYLKQDKITYNHGKIVNTYIFHEINKICNIRSHPTLENSLFGAVSLTKNVDIDKNKYSGYDIGFDRKEEFSFGNRVCGNVIIFWVDMSSSPHIDNKKKDIFILGKGPTQGLDHTLTAEKMYSTNFTEKTQKNFVSVSIIMEQIVIYLLMVQKWSNSKQKILKYLQLH